MGFKKDFIWGAAAAAYQIEGAVTEDGKGLSIWDMFCKKPGVINEGQSGEIACDHYHRYKEDVQLMKQIGIKAYRLSFSWPRIIPDGIGDVNPKGIEFYNNLIDELLANGITPYVTLYHWDLPLALYNKGGWANPESPDWFANYAKVVAENFSDRVKNFITFNEPQCFIGICFVTGEHAPGLKMSLTETIPMSHYVMLAHGKAVKAMRQYGAKDIKIGYAPTFAYAYPETNSTADIEAARSYNFSMNNNPNYWHWNVTWWSDPVYFGKYPKDGLEMYGQYLPKNYEKDLPIINQPLDFLGQNIYNGPMIRAGDKGKCEQVPRYEGFPHTNYNWPVEPNALKWCAKFLYERYKLPIVITENGMSCHDAISLDGAVHDPNRIDFLHRYLLALKEAADEGTDISAYFLWSIMDNFEWNKGYYERFGLIYVDFRTQKRIIKDSGYWYKEVIEHNGENL